MELADAHCGNICVRVCPPKVIMVIVVREGIVIKKAPQVDARFGVDGLCRTEILGIFLFFLSIGVPLAPHLFISGLVRPQNE